MSTHARRRRGAHAEHENNERWLLTYADMITLLVAFFIMLYAMSVTNIAKFTKLAISVRTGFGTPSESHPSILIGNGVGEHPAIAPSLPKVHPSSITAIRIVPSGYKASTQYSGPDIKSSLDKIIREARMKDHLSVETQERGIVVSVIADKYTFDSGSADLKPELKPVLAAIDQLLKTVPNLIRIEGHTDNRPISTARFASNWQLSVARAANVLCYFTANGGIKPDRISCAGYAETRPRVQNTSDHNRALNRRVDIVIVQGREQS